MRSALALHDEVLRSAIESAGGWLFKHTGDGVCAAFASASAAIDAAVEAQRRLELPVRMGVATGEAHEHDGDYFAPALNRAARVMAAGHGGQILVAASTASLVDDVDLVDLGEHRLRDLSVATRLFQVQAEGLAVVFPRLRTVDAVPGNLPAQVTSFVGRGEEVKELTDQARRHRLVTLTGVGGVGKTRLAVHVAAELAAEFPDGVWLVELAPVGDAAAVPDVVATTLGVTSQASLTVADSIIQALEGRRLLMVLDNCEHVLGAAGDLVETVLVRAPTVTVMATSREGLGVSGEHLWPVPSLDVRSGVGSAAVELFVERAQAVRPDFTLGTGTEAEAVVEICRRVDGIALAIELAAARMVSMSPTDVCDRLGDRFRLLSGSRRALERHQTLRNTVQWSYDLLDDDERVVLGCCAVFAGGFDLAAAAHVCGDRLSEYAVLDRLDSLVRKSLITVEQEGIHLRYGLLETVRQFAEEQLAATGPIDEVRNRHSRYFAAKSDAILELWASPQQREAYRWIDIEFANLRTGFRWAASHDDLHSAAGIAVGTSIVGVWIQRYEQFAWAEELLDSAIGQGFRRLPSLYAAAAHCFLTGRIDDAYSFGRAAVDLNDQPDYDPVPFAYCYLVLGAFYSYTGQLDRNLQTAAACRQRADDRLTTGPCQLAFGLAIAKRLDEAQTMAEEAVAATTASGIPSQIAYALTAYGRVLVETDPARALEAMRRARAVAHDSDNTWNEAMIETELVNRPGIVGGS